MDTGIALGLLVFVCFCLLLLWWDHWATYHNLQRWERRQIRRNGGYGKQPAYTVKNPWTGTELQTGSGDLPETMGECKLTLVRGEPTLREGTRPILLVPAFNNSYLWPIESGELTGEDGADSGRIPPGSAA